MKTLACNRPLYRVMRAWPRFTLPAALGLIALCSSTAFAAPAEPLLRVNQIMWHEVVGQNHQSLGYIDDLLLDMQTGRILFVAVEPQELFHQSKVVRPETLVLRKDGTLELNAPLDAWVHAPWLSLNGREIEAVANNGVEVQASYDATWTSSRRNPMLAANSLAAPGMPQPIRFVSMQALLNETVKDTNGQAIGGIGGFLVDWPGHRAVYALIARGNSASSLITGVSNGYAIPTAILTPTGDGRSLVINASIGDLTRAPLLTRNNTDWQRNPAQVYRFRATNSVAATARRPAQNR